MRRPAAIRVGTMTDREVADAAEMVTVVLADDHELVRDGIRLVLEAEPVEIPEREHHLLVRPESLQSFL